MGRTVNPLSYDFSGSNPLLPTLFEKFDVRNRMFDVSYKTSNFKSRTSNRNAEVAHLVER